MNLTAPLMVPSPNTIEIKLSKDWSNYQVTQETPFQKLVWFSWKPKIKTTGLISKKSGYCQGRPNKYLDIFPWEDCSNPSLSECLFLPDHGGDFIEHVLIESKRNFIHWEDRTTGAQSNVSYGPVQPFTLAVFSWNLLKVEMQNQTEAQWYPLLHR